MTGDTYIETFAILPKGLHVLKSHTGVTPIHFKAALIHCFGHLGAAEHAKKTTLDIKT